MTVVKEFFAGTGAGTPAAEQLVKSSSFTFDKNTCVGQIGGYTDPLYFTVSDSGTKIKLVHGKSPRSQYLYAELWELNKQ